VKKLRFSPVLAATVAATVYTNPYQASAGTFNFTNAFPITASGVGSHTVSLSPDIPNADELLSISDGSLTGGESASFTLSVQYINSTTQQIFSQTWNGFGPGYALTNVPNESFTLGDINGLVFNLANTGAGTPQLSIPAGTVFSFHVSVVPEPASAALFALKGLGIWAFVRRLRS